MKALKLIVIFGIMSLILPIESWAEEKEEEVIKLEEIVVSATKTEAEIKTIPTNITVISRKDLDRYEARDLSDLLHQIPGFHIAPQAYGVRADVSVSSRGNEPSSRGAIIMVNGIEYSNASGYFNVRKIPIKDIERIEVIKSPSSALYGDQATGGVISITTRISPEPLEVKVGGAYGSFDTKKAYTVFNGSQKNWEYFFEGRFLDTDGYQDNSWEDDKNFYGRVKYYLDETSSIEFHGTHLTSGHGYPGPLTLEQFEANNKQTNQPQGDSEGDYYLGAFVFKKDFGSSELLCKMKYDEQVGWFIDIGAYFDVDNYIVIPEINYTIRHSIGKMENTILTGVEYRHYEAESKVFNETEGVKGNMIKDADADDQILALFLQDELRVTDDFSVTFGVRYDRFEREWDDKINPANNLDISDSALSPKVGATYSFSDAANIFAGYSRGFKKPTISAATFNPDLKPEHIDSYELGLRGTPTPRTYYNTALFLTDTKNKVIKIQPIVPVTYENAGEIRSYGIELGGGFELDNGLYGSLNYTYQLSKFKEYTLASGVSYNDKKVPRVPNHLLGIAIGYRNDRFGDLGCYINHTGSKYFDNANSREWESFTVLNARYSKRFKGWKPNVELFLAGENLTDKKYVEVGFAGQGWESLYVTPGRSVIGGLNFYF